MGELDVALREVWGGLLCVSAAPRSEADLLAVQEALSDVPGALSSAPDSVAGAVDLTVVRGTQEQQRALDGQFGAGAVRLWSRLGPIDRWTRGQWWPCPAPGCLMPRWVWPKPSSYLTP